MPSKPTTRPSSSIPMMPQPGTTKAVLSITRATIQMLSDATARRSGSIQTMPQPGTTKAMLSKPRAIPPEQMPPSPKPRSWGTVGRAWPRSYIFFDHPASTITISSLSTYSFL